MIREAVTAWWTTRRSTRETARQWAAAETFDNLTELTAQWLEGELTFHPGGYFDVDPETVDLIPDLITMNRAGFLTDGSQPGIIEDGWRQRAAVTGWVQSERVMRALVVAARVEHMLITVHDPADVERPAPFVVTTHNEEPYTRFGAMPRSATRLSYGAACSREAVAAIHAAYQVTIVDPAWGRDHVLWRAIRTALAATVTPTATPTFCYHCGYRVAPWGETAGNWWRVNETGDLMLDGNVCYSHESGRHVSISYGSPRKEQDQ